ncbi:MAG TPA: hypothetical protein VKU41_01540, partial [Polyangiaceae bacterium]|nr:hypothetical protein [Polyangiaceae bacterium]
MRASFVLAFVLAVGAWIAACGSNGNGANALDGGGSLDATAPPDGVAPPFGFGDGSSPADDGAGVQGTLTISPSGVQTITVASGQTSPTVTFTATLNGVMVPAGWSLDRGDIGRVQPGPSATTTFTPTGTTGGLVTISAGYAGKTASAQVFVKIAAQQNGADPSNPAEQAQIPTGTAQLTAAGGVGGVGGEGLGVPVSDPATVAALRTPGSDGHAEGLVFLYPYDQTVWPRGLLAPLVMWRWTAPPTPGPLAMTDGGAMDSGTAGADSGGDAAADAGGNDASSDGGSDAGSNAAGDAGSDAGRDAGTSVTEAGSPVDDADAILLTLSTTSGSFSWSGTFGRPAILAQTGGSFVRHPIPQDVWAMATNTAGGALPGGGVDRLVLTLTVARHGVAYGPISETWTVAPGRLSGIIYYNSYGSQLAQNYGGAVGGNGQFGGAVLSIHVGDTGPQLVAGSNGGVAQCRTCHSVAARGSRLVVQHGDDYSASSSYDLTPQGSVEHVMTNSSSYYPGVYPDGSFALDESGQILPLPSATTLPPVTGLSGVATDLGTPSFSPDGKRVVFN